MNPENGLEYDCSLTSNGIKILEEISNLESEWEEVVGISLNDCNVLSEIALNSFEISYKHKKKQGFIF